MNKQAYEAAAYWGSGDTAFSRYQPTAGKWHTIALSYAGGTNSAYYAVTDGQINTSETKTLDIWPNNPMTVGCAYDGSPDVPPGTIIPNYFFSGALAKLKVYNVYIPPANLAMLISSPVNINGDSLINFNDPAIFANNWMVGPVLLGD